MLNAPNDLGAAICASPSDPEQIARGLQSLLTSDRFGQAANQFAARYADYNPDVQIERLVNRAEELAV